MRFGPEPRHDAHPWLKPILETTDWILWCGGAFYSVIKFFCFDIPSQYLTAGVRYLLRENYHRQAQKNRLLPRKRNLSVGNLPVSLNSQGQGLLLKLPWEVRSQIYSKVLGGSRVHIEMGSEDGFTINRVCPYFCREPDTNFAVLHSECYRYRERKGDNPIPRPKDKAYNTGALALLQTCRQIYSDAVDVLYTSNSFQPTTPESLFMLSNILLPQRFQMIQTLEMEMNHRIFKLKKSYPTTMAHVKYSPERLKEYQVTWELLGSMKGLKTLRVALVESPYIREWWNFILPRLQEPISQVSGPLIFEVYFCPPSKVIFESKMWGSCTVYGIREKEASRYLTGA